MCPISSPCLTSAIVWVYQVLLISNSPIAQCWHDGSCQVVTGHLLLYCDYAISNTLINAHYCRCGCARDTWRGARDMRDTCDGGQWGVEMCRDQVTSWHAWHVWWMDTCPGVSVITLSTARGDGEYIYIHPGIMISGSMVMIAASTVQWHYLSRTFHDVGVSSPSERTFKILFRKSESTFTIIYTSLWLFDFWSLNLPSQVSWHSWVYLRVLEPALPQSLQRPKTPRSAASHTAVRRAVHAAANITSGIPNTRTFHFTHNIQEDKYIRQHFARKLNMQFPAIVAISRICNK